MSIRYRKPSLSGVVASESLSIPARETEDYIWISTGRGEVHLWHANQLVGLKFDFGASTSQLKRIAAEMAAEYIMKVPSAYMGVS